MLSNQWKNRKKYLYGERGLWLNDKNSDERRWMLSDRENIHRMRCKLNENDYFNKHEVSSRLRDNLGIDSIIQTDQDNSKETFKNELKENSHGNDENELFKYIKRNSIIFI